MYLVVDAPFLLVLLFVVRLHGHLHTLLRFLLLLTTSLPLWFFGRCLIPSHCFSGFHHSPIRKMPSYLDSCLGFAEVRCINMTCKYQVTCMVRDYYILVWCHIISENFHFLHCCVCWICLFRWYGVECCQHCAIRRSCTIQKLSCHLMDNFPRFVEIWRLIFWFRVLLPRTIIWWYILVRLICSIPGSCYTGRVAPY